MQRVRYKHAIQKKTEGRVSGGRLLRGLELRHPHKSDGFLTAAEWIRKDMCAVRCCAEITFTVLQSTGAVIYRYRSETRPLRQLSFDTSADQPSFLNVSFNITLWGKEQGVGSVEAWMRQNHPPYIAAMQSFPVARQRQRVTPVNINSRMGLLKAHTTLIHTHSCFNPLRGGDNKADFFPGGRDLMRGGSRSSAVPHLLRDESSSHRDAWGGVCSPKRGRAIRGLTTALKENY